MEEIPKLNENEIFKQIEEQPGYYLSNLKRVYNIKTKHFMKIYANSCFENQQHKKICINYLFEKYFNQPDELSLIAIINYQNRKFRDYYYDKSANKFYHFKNGIYYEMEQHDIKKCKTKQVYLYDITGTRYSLHINKFKKQYLNK